MVNIWINCLLTRMNTYSAYSIPMDHWNPCIRKRSSKNVLASLIYPINNRHKEWVWSTHFNHKKTVCRIPFSRIPSHRRLIGTIQRQLRHTSLAVHCSMAMIIAQNYFRLTANCSWPALIHTIRIHITYEYIRKITAKANFLSACTDWGCCC